MTFSSIYKLGFRKYQVVSILLFLGVALLHKFIANDKHIIGRSDQGIVLFKDAVTGHEGIKGIIPYSANFIDKNNRRVGPFDKQDVKSMYYRHWLGTDEIGRDLLAGLIYGCFVALKVGFVTMFFSLFISLFFAYFSGYHGDGAIRVNRFHFILLIPVFLLSWFYTLYSSGVTSIVFFLFPFLILIYFINVASRQMKMTTGIPFDGIILRLVEIMGALPGLFFMLILLSMMGKPSLWNVIWVITFLSWPRITRHLRAEILKIRKEDYIVSAKSINLKDWKIYLFHVLPMAASPIFIVLAFSFSAAILLESTLSFLGIGIPANEVTWGSLIRGARNNFDAWWLALFPGIMIYLLIFLFNSIGDSLNERLRKI